MLSLDPALRLNPIRRNRSLDDVLAAFFLCFFFEDLVEGFSELFPFFLGGRFSFDRGEEFSTCVDESDLQGCWGSGEAFFDLFGLAGPEEAAFLPWVSSRSLAVSSERKLDGWKPWTATDNRSPILARTGYGNLFLLSPTAQISP